MAAHSSDELPFNAASSAGDSREPSSRGLHPPPVLRNHMSTLPGGSHKPPPSIGVDTDRGVHTHGSLLKGNIPPSPLIDATRVCIPGSAGTSTVSIPPISQEAPHAQVVARADGLLPPSLDEYPSDSESEGGSIPDPGGAEGLSTSESDSDSGAAGRSAGGIQVCNKRRQQPSLPTDPSDPCEGDDLLAESARERLESFFGHLGQEDVGDIRPSEPEWQPSRSVSEWAGLIWASVPPALRWWVTEVERQDPLSPQRRCLPLLRALVVAWAA